MVGVVQGLIASEVTKVTQGYFSGSGTVTAPTTAKNVTIYLWGAGGGGNAGKVWNVL